MNILVAGAVGRGPTELAAFDAALVAAGVADRNLIYLSSVLPPASSVEQVDRIGRTPGSWGDRLYCVVARARTAAPDAQAWAGLGWVQDDCGRGLLVEHDADDEVSLRGLVTTSLDALCRNRGTSFPSRGIAVAGARCTGRPVCALVVAVFQSVAWEPGRRPARAAAPV
ncbi:pyruvoyl-dependent arginine decarboxylase [Micromonospora sp. NPDC005252]|uniref:pyruvoyl-dependent arginine decarboxylase n=1 Tax=Micromonospora sp. NPDC005252 TaxID=3364228 RepID=UPI00368ED0BA